MKAQYYALIYTSLTAILLYQVASTLFVSSQVVAYGSTLADLEKQKVSILAQQQDLAQQLRQQQRIATLQEQATIMGFNTPTADHILRLEP